MLVLELVLVDPVRDTMSGVPSLKPYGASYIDVRTLLRARMLLLMVQSLRYVSVDSRSMRCRFMYFS